MLLNLSNKGKINWVSKVRDVLCINGFQYAWENQGVGCTRAFLSELQQRLVDCRWQKWNEHISSSDRFRRYRNFKTIHGLEPYLILDLNRFIRYVVTQFRFRMSSLCNYRKWYKRIELNELN